jgi:hypothetical protein
MRRSSLPAALATGAICATAAVAVWGFSLDPEPALRWFILGGSLPVLWAYLECGQVRGKDANAGVALMALHRWTIAFLGVMLSSSIGLRLMVHEGFVDPLWLGTAQRFRWLILGGAMAVFGNLLPTLKSPWSFHRQPFSWQQVHRFVGWTLVLGGIGIIGSWSFLPADAAVRRSTQIVAVVVMLSVGRKLASLAAHSLRPH